MKQESGQLMKLRWPALETNDFQKADRQGKKPFAKSGVSRDWTLFPKTPKWLRRGHEPATGSLTRTRPEEAYLGVLCGGTGGGFLARKSHPDSPRSKRKNPFVNNTWYTASHIKVLAGGAGNRLISRSGFPVAFSASLLILCRKVSGAFWLRPETVFCRKSLPGKYPEETAQSRGAGKSPPESLLSNAINPTGAEQCSA
jgi:hypothetical protein